jgi:Uncharacterized conserved protein (DUF2358)
MDLIEIVKADYQKFPEAQTYEIYDKNVYFKDPVFSFRGLDRYKLMIGFITTWFKALKLELHEIDRIDDTIKTRFTLEAAHLCGWLERVKSERGKSNSLSYRLLGMLALGCRQTTSTGLSK